MKNGKTFHQNNERVETRSEQVAADIGSSQSFTDQDRLIREMRASIDSDGDFVVNIEDGRGPQLASALLDELDAEAADLVELEMMIDGWKGKP